MATGDITIAVNADGRTATLTVEGFAPGASYDFGFGTDRNPADATVRFVATSLGFDANGDPTTIARQIKGVPSEWYYQSGTGYVASTDCMRLPYQGAGAPVPDETNSAGSLVVDIALSDVIFGKDNTGVGNSGVAVTAEIDAAFITNAAGSSETSNAFSGTVTNNSTRVYPPAIGQWDWYAGACHRDRVTADFRLAFNARGKYRPACVRFDVTDESTNTAFLLATSQTPTERSLTGLWGESFRSAAFNLSQFDQNELLTCRARVYPTVGDSGSVLDTESHTTAAEIGLGRNRMILRCDKSAALEVIRWVATTGNDTTGDGSESLPYATIGKAAGDSPNVIYLKAGTYTDGFAPAVRFANTEWCIVRPAPGEDETTVIVQYSNASSAIAFDIQWLQFDGVRLQATATNCRLGGGTEDHLRFTGLLYHLNTFAATLPVAYQVPLSIWQDSTIQFIDDLFEETGSQVQRVHLDGCALDATVTTGQAGVTRTVTRAVACTGQGVGFTQPSNTSSDNGLLEFNALYDMTANIAALSWESQAFDGVSIVGNIVESTHGSTAQAANAARGVVNSNACIWNNVFVGERSAFFYEESALASDCINGTRLDNLEDVGGTKHDDFGANAAFVHQWEHFLSAGSRGNWQRKGEFPFQWSGFFFGGQEPGGAEESASFVDDAGDEYGSGLGNGDYRVLGAEARGYTYTIAAWEPVVSIDLTGRPRPSTPQFRGALLPVPNAPTNLAQA